MAHSRRYRPHNFNKSEELANTEKQILKFLHDHYQSPTTQHEAIKIAKGIGKKTKHEINKFLYNLKKMGYVEKVIEAPPTWRLLRYEPLSPNNFQNPLMSSTSMPSTSGLISPSSIASGDFPSTSANNKSKRPLTQPKLAAVFRGDVTPDRKISVSNSESSSKDDFVIPPPPDVLLRDATSCFYHMSVKEKELSIAETQQKIISIISNHDRITLEDLTQNIPDQDINSIDQAISNLLRENTVQKIGNCYSIPLTTGQQLQMTTTTIPKSLYSPNDEQIQNGEKAFNNIDYTNDVALEETSFPSSLPTNTFIPCSQPPATLPITSLPVLKLPDGKSAISLLNEFAQRNNHVPDYTESMSGPDHRRRFTMTVRLGSHSFMGPEAPTKKDAKLKAAEVALASLCNAGKIESASGLISPTYGASSQGEASLHDKIASLVVQKYNSLSALLPDTIVGKKIIAGFVMTRKLKSEEITMDVVSIGSGNRCVKGDKLSLRGETVNDCHAEVIARRGLVRYLYQELIKQDGNSIFILEEDKYVLKPDIEFHLFINTAPCGDSAIFAPSDVATDQPDQVGSDGSHHPVFENKKQGLLRTKVENGEGCIPIEEDTSVPTWDGILRGERLRTMSCSDKIAKWNFLGLQGSLLSRFMKPIYMSTLTLGMLYNHGHLTRAICCRVQKFMDELGTDVVLPVQYSVHHPKVSGQHQDREIAKMKTREFSVNWCSGDLRPEVLDGTTGKSEQRFGSTELSRVCKSNLFKDFKTLCAKLEKQDLFKDGYYKSKMQATEYQKAKQTLWNAFEKNGFGKWMPKPKEEKDF